MSTEEDFLQQFAKLFAHYRDALTLNTNGDRGGQLERLNEVAERDRMIAAGRLALLEIETNPRMEDNFRHPCEGQSRRNGLVVDLGTRLQDEV